MTADQTIVTAEGLDKLKAELRERLELRKEIADRIARAKEQGDLSENAEYTDARDQQSFNEGRLQELDILVKRAVVVEKKKSDTAVVGSVVRVETQGQIKEFIIVGSNEADPLKGRISHESPLGQAFLGKKVGDAVELNLPRGNVVYRIVAID